jgi:hypothetical protein
MAGQGDVKALQGRDGDRLRISSRHPPVSARGARSVCLERHSARSTLAERASLWVKCSVTVIA